MVEVVVRLGGMGVGMVGSGEGGGGGGRVGKRVVKEVFFVVCF